MMLGLGFTAKSFCSCIYVSLGSEQQCREYAALKQVSPKLKIDATEQSTTSTLFFFFSRKAVYKPEEKGCVLL
jgi:hypothetical protein